MSEILRCRKCHKALPDISAYCLYCGTSLEPQKKKSNKKKRPNGTGSVFKKPNGKYRAEVVLYYYEENGQRKKKCVTKVFDSAAEAYAALPSLRSITKSADKLLDLQKIFIESRKYQSLSQSQQDKLGYAWKRLSPLHNKKISDLTVDEMQSTINAAVSTFYPARDMKVMLSHLYELAAQRDLVSSNKTEFIELPPKTDPNKDSFTEDELSSLWSHWDKHHSHIAGYLLIMTYCGLRYGEMATIKTKNVYIDKQYMIGGIKTKAGKNREIPISEKILPVVQLFFDQDKEYLMTMSKDDFYNGYKEIFKQCGIRSSLTPHTCRHTFFTRLASMSDVSPAVIAAAGGHKKFSTTVNIKNPYEQLKESKQLDFVCTMRQFGEVSLLSHFLLIFQFIHNSTRSVWNECCISYIGFSFQMHQRRRHNAIQRRVREKFPQLCCS